MKSKRIKILAILVILSNLFWIGGVILDFNYTPYNKLRVLGWKINDFVEDLRFKWEGEEVYIKKTINSQLPTSSGIRKGQKLETAILPLKRTYISLIDYGFATRGDIGVVADKVLLLDDLGKLFELKGENLFEIPIEFPDNLNEYILSVRKNKLKVISYKSTTIFSLLDFAFDHIHSRLVFSFLKYHSDLDKRYVSVASVGINIGTTSIEINNDWMTIVDTMTLGGGGGEISIIDNNLYFANGFSPDMGISGFSELEENSTYGKVFKVNLQDNQIETFSRGHRNISNFFVCENNMLIASEHGPQGGDEINIIEKNSNYGWPARTFGTRYGTYDHTFESEPLDLLENYKEPLFSFVPSVGLSTVTQLYNFHPSWNGDLLAASLKGQTLYRLKLEKEKIVFCEPIWMGHRIREIIQHEEKIILLTDDANLITLTVD